MRSLIVATALLLAVAGCGPAVPQTPDAPEPPPQSGAMCGGLAGLSCGAGEYCAYPPAAQCGAADQTGICKPRPEVCIEVYDPVCGCDGQTYANSCKAAAAAISVAHGGACVSSVE